MYMCLWEEEIFSSFSVSAGSSAVAADKWPRYHFSFPAAHDNFFVVQPAELERIFHTALCWLCRILIEGPICACGVYCTFQSGRRRWKPCEDERDYKNHAESRRERIAARLDNMCFLFMIITWLAECVISCASPALQCRDHFAPVFTHTCFPDCELTNLVVAWFVFALISKYKWNIYFIHSWFLVVSSIKWQILRQNWHFIRFFLAKTFYAEWQIIHKTPVCSL